MLLQMYVSEFLETADVPFSGRWFLDGSRIPTTKKIKIKTTFNEKLEYL